MEDSWRVTSSFYYNLLLSFKRLKFRINQNIISLHFVLVTTLFVLQGE